jgi:hypothetical protein
MTTRNLYNIILVVSQITRNPSSYYGSRGPGKNTRESIITNLGLPQYLAYITNKRIYELVPEARSIKTAKKEMEAEVQIEIYGTINLGGDFSVPDAEKCRVFGQINKWTEQGLTIKDNSRYKQQE